VYFYPFEWPFLGYSKQAELEQSARDSLKKTRGKYEMSYPPMQYVHFGEKSTEPVVSQADVAYVSDLKHIYGEANDVTKGFIQDKEVVNRMNFPEWTEIPLPERTEREGGTYFFKTWGKHKLLVQNECRLAQVTLDDNDIGFATRFKGGVPGLEKSKELLREMHITEQIIHLCINAKLAEENRERSIGKQPEAFMRIMQVEPKDSEPTGPTALRLNSRFDPNEKNPASPNFRKYIVDSWPVFVQEYPVKIQLMCDSDSFIHFLHSIRTGEGQFLVIRQLEILSPAMMDSKSDISETKDFKPVQETASTDPALRRWPTKSEQIVVTIIAAGMDFFDPKEFPYGLYQKKAEAATIVRKQRRTLGTAPVMAPQGQ
jgi:hypothetical protein